MNIKRNEIIVVFLIVFVILVILCMTAFCFLKKANRKNTEFIIWRGENVLIKEIFPERNDTL
jgi:hypothetical protein